MPEDRSQYANSANLARRGDLHSAYAQTKWFDWVGTRMDLQPAEKLLDVGAGPGWFWRAVAGLPKGLELTVLDKSPGMVAEAEARLAGGRFESVKGVVGDAMDLPFPDATFDTVVIMHVLYHTPDPAAALAEAGRVLRPGGHIHIALNSHDDLQSITDLIIGVYGRAPMDFAATPYFLDQAEADLATCFMDVTRQDLTETYNCTDPDIVFAFALSMPPANQGDDAAKAHLRTEIEQAITSGGGVLSAKRHTGLISGVKPMRLGEE